MSVEIKYYDIDGNEIDHEPLFASAGFQMPQRGERERINSEMWTVARSEVVYPNPTKPGTTLIKTYCEKAPSQ
jgi:hypothetical protein